MIAEKFLGFIIKSRLAGTHANTQFEELEQVVVFLLHSECKKTVSVLMEICTFFNLTFLWQQPENHKRFLKKLHTIKQFS